MTFCDVPQPTNVRVTFVYNFFTPDERTNATGGEKYPNSIVTKVTNKGKMYFRFRKTQKEVSEKTVQLSIPRYVLIEFTAKSVGGGTLLENDSAND